MMAMKKKNLNIRNKAINVLKTENSHKKLPLQWVNSCPKK